VVEITGSTSIQNLQSQQKQNKMLDESLGEERCYGSECESNPAEIFSCATLKEGKQRSSSNMKKITHR
jgi:hypothetical protein